MTNNFGNNDSNEEIRLEEEFNELIIPYKTMITHQHTNNQESIQHHEYQVKM